MGRYDFRPTRVHQTATKLLRTAKLQNKPPWYEVVGRNPPSQKLVRTQPNDHSNRSKPKPQALSSEQYRPRRIVYDEDTLRRTFFVDHPWELARPRLVIENDGRNATNGSRSLLSSNHTVSGEGAVQRQLYLMQGGMTRASAYDQARREFYQSRLQDDAEVRVAKEEALATGAYFGQTTIHVGAELEDESYESWRHWADRAFTELEQKSAGGLITPNVSEDEPEAEDVGINVENGDGDAKPSVPISI